MYSAIDVSSHSDFVGAMKISPEQSCQTGSGSAEIQIELPPHELRLIGVNVQMPRRPASVHRVGTVVSVTSFNVAKLGQFFLIGLRVAASQVGHGIHPTV